jgi:uncharacterized protein (TIGR00251 family)
MDSSRSKHEAVSAQQPSPDASPAGAADAALQASGDGCRLAVHVQPRAKRSGVDGYHGKALRIRLAAEPVDGAANEALVAWLAEQLGLPRRALRVEHGLASRHKRVAIGAPLSQVARWLAAVAPPRES